MHACMVLPADVAWGDARLLDAAMRLPPDPIAAPRRPTWLHLTQSALDPSCGW